MSFSLFRPVVRGTLWRTLLTFCFVRLVIIAILALYLLLNVKKETDPFGHELYWQTCAVYIALAASFLVLALRYRQRLLLQLSMQISVDIVAISILYVAADGMKSGLAILYLFPLAGGAILAPLVPALFFVSVTALFLLAEAGYQMLVAGSEPVFLQAGLYGAAYFAAVVSINRLAGKLIEEEALATRRGADLRIQQAINHLVMADMGDGILVIGRDGEVLTVNPAAARMLGLSSEEDARNGRLSEMPFMAPIAEALSFWMSQSSLDAAGSDAGAFVMIKPRTDGASAIGMPWGSRSEIAVHVKLRFARVDTRNQNEERTVIFLQDVSEIENRAQQLKLASMGRLTASIAHEVRNPLSAIAHASSLLAEETGSPAEQRLLSIIGDNVARLNRMIEDILKLSRKAQMHHQALELAPFLAEILAEFCETHHVRPGLIRRGEMAQYRVRFDPLHLREVIVNLLTNALRYASGEDSSIRIDAFPVAPGRIELHVQDDGPTISPEVRAHLFEPFYTTSNKGTGLGLYLARELCLNNGAMIDYEYRADDAASQPDKMYGRFVITLTAAD